MKELIRWLMSVEQLAYDFYNMIYQGDIEQDKLRDFVKNLADDEKWHLKLMEKALNYIDDNDLNLKPQIVVDDQTKERLIAPIKGYMQEFTDSIPDSDRLLECIVKAEFSEWNDIFLYVINTLKEYDSQFQYIASKLENHKNYILDFLKEMNLSDKDFVAFGRFPNVWNIKILIVEDSEPIRELLVAIFADDYLVTTAVDGAEGLNLLTENYFDVIISDIDMPNLDGIKMIRDIISKKPEIMSNMLVHSGFITAANQQFLNENNIVSIKKPADISQIIANVEAILTANNRYEN